MVGTAEMKDTRGQAGSLEAQWLPHRAHNHRSSVLVSSLGLSIYETLEDKRVNSRADSSKWAKPAWSLNLPAHRPPVPGGNQTSDSVSFSPK